MLHAKYVSNVSSKRIVSKMVRPDVNNSELNGRTSLIKINLRIYNDRLETLIMEVLR